MNTLKHLSAEAFDHCKTIAMERVKERAIKPSLAQFKKHNRIESGLLILYALASVIFIVAFAVSSQHIIAFANVVASSAHIPESTIGLTAMVRASYYWIHELGLLLLAETSMLTFMVMARITPSIWHKLIMYVIALSSASFVIYANLQSGLVWYLSVLVPCITIGVSLIFEHYFVHSIREERRVRTAYETALTEYQYAQTDPTQHADYFAYLRQSVFEGLLECQNGAGSPQRRAWLMSLNVPERAYLADSEIKLNDWAISAIAPSTSITAIAPSTPITITREETTMHANGNGNGNYPQGKSRAHNGT